MSVEQGEIYNGPRQTLERFRQGLEEKDCISVVNYLEPLFLRVFEKNETIPPEDIETLQKSGFVKKWADDAEEAIANGLEPWHPLIDPRELDSDLFHPLPKGFQIISGSIRVHGADGSPTYYKVDPETRREALGQLVAVTGGLLPQLQPGETEHLRSYDYVGRLMAGFHPEAQFSRETFRTFRSTLALHDRKHSAHLMGAIGCPPLFRAHGIQLPAAKSLEAGLKGKSLLMPNGSWMSLPVMEANHRLNALTGNITSDILYGIEGAYTDLKLAEEVERWYDRVHSFVGPIDTRLIEATAEQLKYTIAFLRDPDADLRQLPIVHSAIEAMYNVSSSVDLSKYEVPTDEDMLV